MSKTTHIVMFGRFSDESQKVGTSTQRQETAYADDAKRLNLPQWEKKYWDEGLSGFTGEHLLKGKFGQLLRDCQAKTFPAGSVIWFEDCDRFGRMDQATNRQCWAKITSNGYKVYVHSLGRTFDAKTPEMEMMPIILKEIWAREESQKKSDRLKAAWEIKRQTGRNTKHRAGQVSRACPQWLVPAADGRGIDGTGYNWRDEDKIEQKKTKVVQFLSRPTMRKAARLILTMGQAEVGRELGIKHYAGLTALLQSPTVVGRKQDHDDKGNPIGEPHEGFYPALLSMSEWEQVKAAIKSRQNHKGGCNGRKGLVVQFLSHVYNEKGQRLVNSPSKGKPDTLRPSENGSRVRGQPIRRDVVERTVLDFISGLTVRDISPKDLTGDKARKAELEALVRDRKELVKGLIAKSIKTGADLSDMVVAHKQAITEMEAELEAVSLTLANEADDTLTEVKRLIADELPKMDGDELRAVRAAIKTHLERLLVRVVVHVHSAKSCTITATFRNGTTRKASGHLMGECIIQEAELDLSEFKAKSKTQRKEKVALAA